MESNNSMSLEQYYNIVYDQAFSPSTKHLACGDRYGQLSVFNLSSALSPSSVKGKSATLALNAHNGPVYSMVSVGDVLVSGGQDGIKGWKWSELTKSNSKSSIEPTFTLTLPSMEHGNSDVNCLVYDDATKTLYSGCGDNKIHCWDINTGQLKSSLSGHTAYVHCLCLRGQQLLSGGEDGAVKFWDPANGTKPIDAVYKSGGDYVTSIAVEPNGNWTVFGGSQRPMVYHLSTHSHVTTLDTPPGVITQAILFINDKILTAGSEAVIRHWSLGGENQATIPSTHSHAFSLAYNTHSTQYKMLTVCGDSGEVQVFTNLGYKAFSLAL